MPGSPDMEKSHTINLLTHNAGTLPCRFVIHAVGPVWGEGQEEDKLHRAITGALDLAAQA